MRCSHAGTGKVFVATTYPGGINIFTWCSDRVTDIFTADGGKITEARIIIIAIH